MSFIICSVMMLRSEYAFIPQHAIAIRTAISIATANVIVIFVILYRSTPVSCHALNYIAMPEKLSLTLSNLATED